MQPASFPTLRTARFFSLGEPGPAIQHVWICLHGHDQPVAELAAQLVNLDTPERLLILPEALSRYTLPDGSDQPASDRAMWFAPNSMADDLADAAHYLQALAGRTLAACPAGTPVTVLGYGHGAVVACHWLAASAIAYQRLVLYAAVFPPCPTGGRCWRPCHRDRCRWWPLPPMCSRPRPMAQRYFRTCRLPGMPAA